MGYDAIIIGAGLGGLTSGALLARQGKKVLLLEQHTIVGGCATTFKRKDLTVEVGLHELDGMDSLDIKTGIFRYLGIDERITPVRIPEFYRIKRGNDLDVTVPDNAQQARELLHELFPGEKKGIDSFFSFILQIRTELSRMPLDPLHQLLQLPIFPLRFPALVRAMKKDLLSYMDRIIHNEDLKLILAANLAYYHDDPATTSLTYFSVAQAAYFQGGGYYIKGGSQQLSDALADVIRENGGEILTNRLALRIEMKNGKASGVVHASSKTGKDERCDFAGIIIAGNAISENLSGMLDKKESEKITSLTAKMRPSPSLYSLYLGIDGSLQKENEGAYSTFLYPETVRRFSKMHDYYYLPIEQRGFVVVDYSKIDSGLAPDGKSFAAICSTDRVEDWPERNTDEYKAQKAKMEDTLLERLDGLFPGAREKVFYHALGTARTVERYTRNPAGAVYGFAQTPENETFARPASGTPVKGLYVASAWGRPGGGFTGAIFSGYLAARTILGKDPIV